MCGAEVRRHAGPGESFVLPLYAAGWKRAGWRDVGISVFCVRRVIAVRRSRLTIVLVIQALPAPVGVLTVHLLRLHNGMGASSGNDESSPWPTVALVLLRVESPRPDSRSTVEWRDAGQRYNACVKRRGSFIHAVSRDQFARNDNSHRTATPFPLTHQTIWNRSKISLIRLAAPSIACSGVMFFCVMLASAWLQICSDSTAE
jgi:hypothetical protein